MKDERNETNAPPIKRKMSAAVIRFPFSIFIFLLDNVEDLYAAGRFIGWNEILSIISICMSSSRQYCTPKPKP